MMVRRGWGGGGVVECPHHTMKMSICIYIPLCAFTMHGGGGGGGGGGRGQCMLVYFLVY